MEQGDQKYRLVDTIRQTLPVRMSSPELEENPEFAEFLLAVGQNVTETGVSSQLDADLTQAQRHLQSAKRKWLHQHVLYQELSNLAMRSDVEFRQEQMSVEDEEVCSLLCDSLTLAEVGDYVEDRDDSDPNTALLGLHKEELVKNNPYKQHIPALQQKFLPELEGRLKDKCKQIVSFHFPSSQTDNQQLQLAKATQLPALVENDSRKLEGEKRRLKLDRLKTEKYFWLYFEALMETVEVLDQLILNHRLKLQAEHDDATSNLLIRECDALCLKVKLFEIDLLFETYDSSAIKALRKIKQYLAQKDEATKKELLQVTLTLQAYESVGAEFNAVVEEYARLKNSIENTKWAINDIQRTRLDDQ